MAFKKVRFLQYRNLKDAEISVDSKFIFLIGKNGQGKTNFLEAIYYLCFGSSFRTRINRQIIKKGNDYAALKGEYISTDENEIKILVKILNGNKKEIRVDEKTLADRKNMIKEFPCIVFSHGDMVFAKGTPERRRWFLNQTLSLLDPDFIDLLRSYKKILKNRNICLKSGDKKLLSVYDHELSTAGIIITKKRKKLVEEFNFIFSTVYEKISGKKDDLRIYYKDSWENADTVQDIKNILKNKISFDKKFGLTTTGPHRDSMFFFIDNYDFSQYASTGQLRLISISLRIAQAELFYKITGKKPVFLIDDVLLELDKTKRISFFNNLKNFKQAFFTFLPDESFININDKDVIKYFINNGEIKPWKKQEMY